MNPRASKSRPFQFNFNTDNATSGSTVGTAAADANETICVEELIISVKAAMDVTINIGGEDFIFYFSATGGLAKTFTRPLRGNAGGDNITVTTSVSGDITIIALGYVGR